MADAEQRRAEGLAQTTFLDPLTGIANRRRFDTVLELEWNRATRVRQPLSLLMIDVDFFKSLNDRFGHRSGDECLVQIAHTLRDCLPRSGDLVARYGGEEFAVILPLTGQAGAESVAARMQQAVRDLNIENDPAKSPFVTVSTGIATYEFPQRASFTDLVDASDRALYRAKQNGRNRIEISAIVSLSLT
jgi:diguanylate cyclase (GGDEF)-like protein